MHHSKRSRLTSSDVNDALTLRNVEVRRSMGLILFFLQPVYGFSSLKPLTYRRAQDDRGLSYLDDEVLEFSALLKEDLPKVCFASHLPSLSS